MENTTSDFVRRDGVTPLDMGKIQPNILLQQKSFIINPLETNEYKGFNKTEKLKYLLFHYSDYIMLIFIVIIVTILIYNHYDKDDFSDIILNNALIMLTVYYSALIALKGYKLSMKIHKSIEVQTARDNYQTARRQVENDLLQRRQA
jgi:hypothetical protein